MSIVGKRIKSAVIPDPVKMAEGRYEEPTAEDIEMSENLTEHTLLVLEAYDNAHNHWYLCISENDGSVYSVHPSWIRAVED